MASHYFSNAIVAANISVAINRLLLYFGSLAQAQH
jgi:hypothetical protein